MKLRWISVSLIRLASIAVLLIAPAAAFAQTGGGGSASGATSAASTSTVSLTIPGVVAIDVESDVAFDLNAKLGGPPLGRADTTCVADKFPPAAGCTGPVIYSATGSTTTSSAGTVPAGDIWLSLFTNKSGSTVSLAASAGAWSAAPVATNSHIQMLVSRGTTNTGAAIGNDTATPAVLIAGGAGATLAGSRGGPFGWTRYDQNVRLRVQDGTGNASGAVFNAVSNVTSTLTFTASAP